MSNQAIEAEDDAGSAALLARLDAALVTQAAHEAMEEELLTLGAQLRDAVRTLSSVRSMTAALSRVGRMKAERVQKQVSESAIRDMEGLCEALGVRMDGLIPMPRALGDALPAHEDVEAQAQRDSEAAASGSVRSPAEDSAGIADGRIPTENTEDTEDEEESDPLCESVKDEVGSHESPSHGLAEESQMRPSGTTDVHEEDAKEGNSQAKRESGEGGLSGDTDAVCVPDEPPSTQQNEKESEIETLSPSQKDTKEVETPTNNDDKQTNVVHVLGGSHNASAQVRAEPVWKFDPTNPRTLARSCVECIDHFDPRASFDISTLYSFAGHVEFLLRTIERMHMKRLNLGLPLLEGDLVEDSVKAAEWLLEVIKFSTATGLTLIPLYAPLQSALLSSIHPQLVDLLASLSDITSRDAIIRSIIDAHFWPELALPPSQALMWEALVYLTAPSPAPISRWTAFFEIELSRGRILGQALVPLPLVFLVLAIIIHKTNIMGRLVDARELFTSLYVSCVSGSERDELIREYAGSLRLTDGQERHEHKEFDLTQEIHFIQRKLEWVYQRRRSRKRKSGK